MVVLIEVEHVVVIVSLMYRNIHFIIQQAKQKHPAFSHSCILKRKSHIK